jgi:hypothetical protein
MPKGKIYIASKNFRGAHAHKPPGAINKDVTSGQSKASTLRRDFSPMTPWNGEFFNFEAWWQSRKRYKINGKPVSAEKAKKINDWWLKQTTPKRRCTIAHPKNGYTVSHAEDENGKEYNYVESRKKMYVPRYLEMVNGRGALIECKKEASEGKDLVFVDFDGPRTQEGSPICEEVTVDTLKKYINDTKFPFGHGWVVAAEVAGIDHKLYTQ